MTDVGPRRDLEMQRLKPQMSVDPSNKTYWTKVFEEMDINKDGKVSYKELKQKLSQHNKKLPKGIARTQLRKADTNEDGVLDLEEFLEAIETKDVRHLFYNNIVDRYVHVVVPNSKRGASSSDEIDKEYEEQYTCCPPPLAMILFSVLEIIAFVYDAAVVESTDFFSKTTKQLIYDPHRRAEAWRYLTYMFVHNGTFHLLVNLLVQIMLGLPLEMVHGWWRVSIVYLAGVVAGSLGTSLSDPYVYLAGASGGVYALMTAHVATIIMNWKQMQFAIAQLAIFLVIASVDVGTAIYNRYIVQSVDSQTIGYAAHFAGAIAGLLVGINVLRNLSWSSWENKLWWAALVCFTSLMLAAIIVNIAFPSYYPTQYV